MSVRNTTNRLYNIWGCMKQRCNNPKHTAAAWYHDKGIRVCDEWNTSFKSFETWALCNGYADDLSIDRIDSDKNYCPENCRWIPIAENRRRAIQSRAIQTKSMGGTRVQKQTGKYMVTRSSDRFSVLDYDTWDCVVKTGLSRKAAVQCIDDCVGSYPFLRRLYSIRISGKHTKEGDHVLPKYFITTRNERS